MRVSNGTIIEQPVDLSSDWESPPIWLGHLRDYSVQLFFSGSGLEGVWRLELSNDREKGGNVETADGVVNFTIISGSSQIITEGGDHTWDVRDAGYRWVRVKWLHSAGTGDLNTAVFNAKGA